MSPHSLFRVMGIAEAVSWTLLLGGMVLRAAAGLDVAVTVGGAVHGFVFLAYAVTAVLVARTSGWDEARQLWPSSARSFPTQRFPLISG
ncbi:DUF3817 domain-containing protein [Nesterenkonia pannonica]|uniref:DUF3817 domain-containing protein n=1 Tax=Nesterenkonia pannonica TaxID=1548602 RepID=UPI002164B70A|nr:DUF3817 domain-containing protein [Nesterenkonia pannonica]